MNILSDKSRCSAGYPESRYYRKSNFFRYRDLTTKSVSATTQEGLIYSGFVQTSHENSMEETRVHTYLRSERFGELLIILLHLVHHDFHAWPKQPFHRGSFQDCIKYGPVESSIIKLKWLSGPTRFLEHMLSI